MGSGFRRFERVTYKGAGMLGSVKANESYHLEKKISVMQFKELYYQSGHSIQSIAEMLGTSRSSIRRYMKRHGLGRRLTRYNLRFDDIPEKDLAYFAGLFDGEGNITASIDEHGAVRVEVSVVNTDALLLECRRFFTHYRFRENMGLHRETPTHVLYTHNFKDTHSLLRAILPYLKLKRTRAELMIRLCESRMEHFRKPLTVEERNLVAKIRALNSRKRKRR